MPLSFPNESASAFLRARDFLAQHRTDYTTAVKEFRWPELAHFNWALDYFDTYADGNESAALEIVEEDGRQCIMSFAAMSARSNQVANFLGECGVGRGDCILLMLGNEIALWETLLAAMKLGAVITPATPLLTPGDLEDRIARGNVRHIVASAWQAGELTGFAVRLSRIAVGHVTGWTRFGDWHAIGSSFVLDGVASVTV